MRLSQLLIEGYDCRGPISDSAVILSSIRAGVLAVGAIERDSLVTYYEPIGCTVVLLLQESHIIVSTWPEYAFIMIDILLCNEEMDIDVVAEAITDSLQPAATERHVVTRTIPSQYPAL